MGTPSQQHYML